MHGHNNSEAFHFFLPVVGPLIIATEAMVTAVTGSTTTLSCAATGDPIPFQTWTRNGIAISNSRFQVVSSGSALVISSVREEDQGAYQCHASNIAGSNSATVNLDVISQYTLLSLM